MFWDDIFDVVVEAIFYQGTAASCFSKLKLEGECLIGNTCWSDAHGAAINCHPKVGPPNPICG